VLIVTSGSGSYWRRAAVRASGDEGLAAEPAASPARDRDRDIIKMDASEGLPGPEAKWYPELLESNVKRGKLALRVTADQHSRGRHESEICGED
jgi:hypothetical protein